MRAIIIAAGRGRRLMPTTADQPKCFAPVQGRRILDRIVEAFRANGISDICFIGGYQIAKVQSEYPMFTFRENRDWENNNILESLMCAADLMDQPFLCSYADILYTAGVVAGLMSSSADIALGVDTLWLDRYQFRTQHPPDDAEKVTVSDGRVTRIHRQINPADAHGEFIGVAKFSQFGAEQLKKHYQQRKMEYAGKPFREASVFEKAYLIHLLQDMIEAGVHMTHIDNQGEYMEIDTQEDFELAQKLWRKS